MPHITCFACALPPAVLSKGRESGGPTGGSQWVPRMSWSVGLQAEIFSLVLCNESMAG